MRMTRREYRRRLRQVLNVPQEQLAAFAGLFEGTLWHAGGPDALLRQGYTLDHLELLEEVASAVVRDRGTARDAVGQYEADRVRRRLRAICEKVRAHQNKTPAALCPVAAGVGQGHCLTMEGSMQSVRDIVEKVEDPCTCDGDPCEYGDRRHELDCPVAPDVSDWQFYPADGEIEGGGIFVPPKGSDTDHIFLLVKGRLLAVYPETEDD